MPSPLRLTPVRTALGTVALAVLLAGCGSVEPAAQPTGTPSTTTSPTPSASAEPTPDAGRTDSADERRIRPTASVVGLRRDQRLVVRKSPAPGAAVLERLSPLAQMLAAGEERRVGGMVWQHVEVGNLRGWVQKEHLGYLGRAADRTARLRQTPIGETRVALAVNAVRALGHRSTPVVVKVKHPVVVVDVLEEGDDSVRGTRVRLVLEYGEAGFQVREAAARPICARGVTAEGLCV